MMIGFFGGPPRDEDIERMLEDLFSQTPPREEELDATVREIEREKEVDVIAALPDGIGREDISFTRTKAAILAKTEQDVFELPIPDGASGGGSVSVNNGIITAKFDR